MTKQYFNQERNTPFSFGDGRDKVTWLLANPLERIMAALLNVAFTLAAFAPLGWAMQNELLRDDLTLSSSLLIANMLNVAPQTTIGKVGLGVLVVYFVVQFILLVNSGQSLGKKVVGIRVITVRGEPAGLIHAVILRKFVYNLIWITLIGVLLTVFHLRDNFTSLHLVWIPYLICLGMLTDEEDNCRTLQDKLAGTVVVKKDPIVRQH